MMRVDRLLEGVPPDDAGEIDLMRRVAARDNASLATLFERHHADVRRFIGRMGVPPVEVDDLVQQTFLQVLTAARRFDGRASIRAWLLGVAAIIVRRHRFLVARAARRVTRWLRDEAPQAPSPNGENSLLTKEGLARASAALEKLSSKKREVFVMIVIEGAPGEEVAAALGLPLATVWTRLHHARRELREHLKEFEP